MKVPLSWLKDYVDIDMPVEDLAERLTLAGLEVEAIERIGANWDRDKIFVGQIISVDPHPDADRLTLATVDYGAGQPLTVVTGAPNVKVYEGAMPAHPLKVAFAVVGAQLIDGHYDDGRLLKLKATKIRGVRSEGMVCSEKELGLSDEHEGILYLPADAPVGMPLANYLGDVVLEFDIKGPFAHLYSVISIAREIAALTGKPYRRDVLTILEREPVEIVPQAPFLELEIADPELCPRYSAALIRGVKIGPSPFWMQQRLIRAGMRPINNIVDVTNYVMLELGQPLHAFDYAWLRPRPGGDKPAIIVRRAHPGERMTTLDGVERNLDPEMLLITDGGGPVAIAGVMGGLESEVTENTTDVLLESANFDFINNRRTSQMLKLSSEAATRFGRRVDPELTVKALARAGQLMAELAGGTVEPVYGDLYPGRAEPRTITLDPAYVGWILGIEIPVAEMIRILESLEFQVETSGETNGELKVTVPSYRLDVDIPADLVEEIGRVWGYDRLPATLIADELPPQRGNPALEGEEKVRDVLVGCGLQEVITYSLGSLEDFARLHPGGKQLNPGEYVRIANPLSSEREFMRQTLMSNLLDTIRDNLRYTERMAVFEIGRVYRPRPDEVLPAEPRRLAIAMTGPRTERSWLSGDPGELDFYDLKGVVETLLAHLGLGENSAFTPVEHPTFKPGRTAALTVNGVEVGVMGEVHPLVCEAFGMAGRRVCLLEFDLEVLLEQRGPTRFMQPISRFPAVIQDLAVLVDEDVPASRVEETIKAAGSSLLRNVLLFDLYRGEQIPAGKKSLAYSLTYQADDRTLTDEEVARVQARIVRRLEQELGARLRV
ncbi:MAG: phenylalanine--tRNA ligase subunit beta [Anaerolineae bacterium]|jgi:phenylalanyl-tRNA synthetase beta chain|nr:phenylalanine--tRNA ligase subunit beta [Anaerolineae bacterium]